MAITTNQLAEAVDQLERKIYADPFVSEEIKQMASTLRIISNFCVEVDDTVSELVRRSERMTQVDVLGKKS